MGEKYRVFGDGLKIHTNSFQMKWVEMEKIKTKKPGDSNRITLINQSIKAHCRGSGQCGILNRLFFVSPALNKKRLNTLAVKKALQNSHQGLTFLASCVRGLVPAKSVNQLLMELCDLAVTSQKLSFWLTCGLRFPVSGNVLYRSFSAMMLLKLELICEAEMETGRINYNHSHAKNDFKKSHAVQVRVFTFEGLKLTFLALPCSSPDTAGWLLNPCFTFSAVSSSWNKQKKN